VCVAACVPLLPAFWRYRKSSHGPVDEMGRTQPEPSEVRPP